MWSDIMMMGDERFHDDEDDDDLTIGYGERESEKNEKTQESYHTICCQSPEDDDLFNTPEEQYSRYLAKLNIDMVHFQENGLLTIMIVGTCRDGSEDHVYIRYPDVRDEPRWLMVERHDAGYNLWTYYDGIKIFSTIGELKNYLRTHLD